MNEITIARSYRNAGPAPLYYRYDGQCTAQPAYLEMDEDGAVRVDYSGEIGNAVPMPVGTGRTLRWTVPHNLSPAGIDELLTDVQTDLQTILDGHTIEWDGHNMVGRLTAGAQTVSEDLDYRLYQDADYQRTDIQDAGDWIGCEWATTVQEYAAAPDREAYLEALFRIAASDGIHLVAMTALEQSLDEAVAQAT